MRFFSLEGSFPTVLRDDGRAFIWKVSTSTWGQISARELMADTRTPELSEAEFKIRALVWGADLSLEMTPDPDPEIDARYRLSQPSDQ